MRLTKEELLKRYTWNTDNPMNGDIVAVKYGDIPLTHYTWDRVRMENKVRNKNISVSLNGIASSYISYFLKRNINTHRPTSPH